MRKDMLRLSALALFLGLSGVWACGADGGCGGMGGAGGGADASKCGSGTRWDATKKQCVPG